LLNWIFFYLLPSRSVACVLKYIWVSNLFSIVLNPFGISSYRLIVYLSTKFTNWTMLNVCEMNVLSSGTMYNLLWSLIAWFDADDFELNWNVIIIISWDWICTSRKPCLWSQMLIEHAMTYWCQYLRWVGDYKAEWGSNQVNVENECDCVGTWLGKRIKSYVMKLENDLIFFLNSNFLFLQTGSPCPPPRLSTTLSFIFARKLAVSF